MTTTLRTPATPSPQAPTPSGVLAQHANHFGSAWSRPWRPALLAESVVTAHLVLVAGTSDLPWVGRAAVGVATVALMAAVLALTRSGRPGRRGVGMVIGGLVGTIAGGGAGVMHLIVLGPSPIAVTGVLALASGLVLLVVGTVVATRAVRGWRRLLALPIAIVVLQLVGVTVPLALYATHVPIEPFDAQPPDGATTVVVPTADGVELAAWYFPSTNGAAVLVRHGSGPGSSKASTFAHAEVLASHGYGVLAMDARGHGESDGQAMDWGWYGDSDVAAGVEWLAGRPDVEATRISGLGLSMGGEELIGALATEPRLRAVVAEGVTGRTGGDHDAFGYTGVQAVIDDMTSAITFGTADLLTRASAPTPLADAVRELDGRAVLVITGSPGQERETAVHLQAAAPDAVEVWGVPDAGHTAALLARPAQWEAEVIGFLDAALS